MAKCQKCHILAIFDNSRAVSGSYTAIIRCKLSTNVFWPCHDKRTRRILALPVCLDNLPVCLDNLLTLAGGRVLKNMSTVLESPDFDEEHASR